MSLRRKDDWDEALEEGNRNAGRLPPKPFEPGPDYDYAVAFSFTLEELFAE